MSFTAPLAYRENAWIGVIPADIAHGSEAENDKHDIGYKYIKKRTEGRVELKAPGEPGEYTVRMHDTDNQGKETASIAFTVEE